jgi:hypothetical protein
MKANEIRIAVSPLSNTIYAGKTNKQGNEWLDKADITEDAIGAVAEYMDKSYSSIEFSAGTLIWQPKK